MKQLVCVLFAVVLTLVSGCAYYSKMALPENPIDKDKVQVIKHVSESASGVRLFMLCGVPSAMDLIKKTISEVNGDGIVNLEVTLSEGFFGPLTFPKVQIEGDVVQILGRAAPGLKSATDSQTPAITKLEIVPATSTPAAVLAPRAVDYTFETWKSALLALNNNDVIYEDWYRFLRRTKQKIKYPAWAADLTTHDYDQFLESKKALVDWLIDVWAHKGEEAEKARLGTVAP